MASMPFRIKLKLSILKQENRLIYIELIVRVLGVYKVFGTSSGE